MSSGKIKKIYKINLYRYRSEKYCSGLKGDKERNKKNKIGLEQ